MCLIIDENYYYDLGFGYKIFLCNKEGGRFIPKEQGESYYIMDFDHIIMFSTNYSCDIQI